MAQKLAPLRIEKRWLVDEVGRSVILRGVNLGGDCKVPYPDGGTNHPTDFSNHREVSFIGRPFPLAESDEHFSRLRTWGFNCLRLLTTWEAVEHRGPGDFDAAYLDYFAELCRRAADYDLYVFVDFHNDVWSRMSGGDGAPCWLFGKVGIDYRRISSSESAHVMQAVYDYARGGRQEDRYPTMSWSQNANWPLNGIMWTLFFGGRDFAPHMTIDGQNVQDYMQEHYLAAQREIALRVRDLPNVIGFDSLNEPHGGWIGHALSYRHLQAGDENPLPPGPGLAWSPLDGILLSHGVPRAVPVLGYDRDARRVTVKHERVMNPNRISIWLEGATDPFLQAGALRLSADGSFDVLREDFFQRAAGRRVNVVDDYMGAFFVRVADNLRAINPDWLLFAELDPLSGFFRDRFPANTPAATVNSSHWYDIRTLGSKTFDPDFGMAGATAEKAEATDHLQAVYTRQLEHFAKVSEHINGGAPTLIGEFGIPFDLNGAAAYQAFAQGDRSDAPWKPHIVALDLMYNALDALLLNSAQWNYTASNRNDLAIGDGWNQEDLSIFSRDQETSRDDINSGGRALAGFVRPYAQATQGTPRKAAFDRRSGAFEFLFDADPTVAGATEIFVPTLQYPFGFDVEVNGGNARLTRETQKLIVKALVTGECKVIITRRTSNT